MLKLTNITKDYVTGNDKVAALKGLSVEFRKNEFVAILGPSGCGKTTLLNIVGGLDHYTDGDLIISGRSTKEFNDSDWDAYRNHSIGFVFQSYNLIPHQTVLSNVELALTVSGVSKAERKRRAVEALEKVGLGDKIKNKPNQMSGGQMQRVAIARALVNNPEILLADEPTGALDSVTSVQIMDLLNEIAKDRLVIMVTHNPDLADKYATRTIKLLDGKIIDDSNPYESNEEVVALTKKEQKQKKLAKKNASMSFFTALSLSLNNLMTKKARTFLTSFAGSIGIIGIALILSVSTGVNAYINRVQEDTLSSYPLTIKSEIADMSSLISSISKNKEDSNTAHERDAVYQNKIMYELMNSLTSMETTKNNLRDFKKFIESNKDFIDHTSSIQYRYDTNLSIYTKDKDGTVIRCDSESLINSMMSSYNTSINSSYSSMMSGYSSVWEELLTEKDNDGISELVKEQYDVIYGNWPEEYNEVVLVVSSKNELNDLTLYALGLITSDELLKSMQQLQNKEELDTTVASWSYEEICSKEYVLILPDDQYKEIGGAYVDMLASEAGTNLVYNSIPDSAKIKISGIIRPSEDAVSSMISGSLGYTKALTNYIVDKVANSNVVKAQLADPTTDVLTGLPFPTDDDKELTTEEKASAFKEYLETLSVDKKADIYKDIMSKPSQEYIDNTIDTELAKYTPEQLKAMIISTYSEQTGMDAETISNYINKMSEEEFNALIRKAFAAQIEEQYAKGVATSLSKMTSEQLAMAFNMSLKSYTDENYANLYDNYMPKSVSESTYDDNLKILGYVDLENPSSIYLYASTFADKDVISGLIEKYNNSVEEEDQITYTDLVGLLMSSITTIIDAISYVLIAFVAISLVVSSIMIGIITYISVLERTKEIGILRAIGASKSDISRVFNAETITIGFVSGIIGIGFTLLLTIPINLILHALTGIQILNAQLPTFGAIILVVISMLLTFIAGLVPASIAAKKDPVEALRTE